jgi:formylglycine-generating enzyme required for sulfatase activity
LYCTRENQATIVTKTNSASPMPTPLIRLALAALAVTGLSALPAAAQAPAPQTGATLKDCDVCPELVVLPAGSFVMGSPESEEGHSADESPLHRVTIARRLAVGKYEVTVAEWSACIADGACPGERAVGTGGERQPAVGVSWDDAQAYVAWLSRRTGKWYRLPSEAEWEYAARAGTTTAFHTGPAIGPTQANVAAKPTGPAGGGFAGGFGVRPVARRTVPVGSYPPNAFGLYDVHGNVWEWVEDCVNDGYAGAPADGGAWTTGNCAKRVVRGGAWVDFPVGARSAIRSGLGPADRGRTLGLRVARTLD